MKKLTAKAEKRDVFLVLAYLVFTLYFFQLQFLIKRELPVPVTLVVYFLFYILIIRLLVSDRIIDVLSTPGVKLVLLCMFFLFLSSVNAEFQSKSFYQLVLNVNSILVWFFAVALIRRFCDIKTFLNWILLLGIGFVTIARTGLFREYFPRPAVSGYLSMSGQKVVRETFVYLDANNYAYILVIIMLITIYKILISKCDLWKNIFYYTFLLFSLSSLKATYSRTATVGLILGVLCMLVALKKTFSKKTMGFYLFITAILIFAFCFTNILPEIKHRVKQDIVFEGKPHIIQKSSLGFRIESALFWLDMFMERPLLGWGESTPIYLRWGRPSGSHTYYVDLLAEGGALAFTCFAMFFMTVFLHLKKGIKLLRIGGDPNMSLGCLLLGIMIILLVKGFAATLGEDFWMMSGLSMAFYKIAYDAFKLTKTKKGDNCEKQIEWK